MKRKKKGIGKYIIENFKTDTRYFGVANEK